LCRQYTDDIDRHDKYNNNGQRSQRSVSLDDLGESHPLSMGVIQNAVSTPSRRLNIKAGDGLTGGWGSDRLVYGDNKKGGIDD